MDRQSGFQFTAVLKMSLLAGVALLYLSAVGMVEAFSTRDIIYKTVSLSIALLLTSNLLLGYLTARRTSGGNKVYALLAGLIVGVVSMAMLSALALAAEPLNIRAVLVNVSPEMVKALTFGNENTVRGLSILAALGIASSLLGAIIHLLPPLWRRAILYGLIAIVAVGTLEELLDGVVTNIFDLLGSKRSARKLLSFFFGKKGLSTTGAMWVFILGVGLTFLGPPWRKLRQNTVARMPAKSQQGMKFVGFLFLIGLAAILPQIMGSYLSEIVVTVALYTLMGFGLNIVVGFAGLLDLGYVAFFAIGAYTMALLTSTQLPQTTELTSCPEMAGFSLHLIGCLSFWEALPIAVGVSALWGILLGVPVLRMRGDYLAIVTLGFGEIIRVLALSNFLQPKVGGAQGILGINKPVLLGFEFKTSQELYYLAVAACLVAAFIAWRLRDSRVGRSWMAMREDEDVAEAMGINLIKTKLLAFATGGALSGLAGAIFAAKLGSVYPHSFNLLVSINVLCLIIVGGIGSLPGVVVGSIALVGLPELLREFSEFRLLIFGALLVTMMLVKPEGFWPAAAQKRELHEHETEHGEALPTPETAPETA
ncbi:MAG: hypothetical protein D6796_16485 [Caldilineae bacterium]|nr:MAG: hypothetical protein D6796_16485 [Caldilineae bacterium]